MAAALPFAFLGVPQLSQPLEKRKSIRNSNYRLFLKWEAGKYKLSDDRNDLQYKLMLARLFNAQTLEMPDDPGREIIFKPED